MDCPVPGGCLRVNVHHASRSTVVVNDVAIEAMCVNDCTNEYRVCVWLKGEFGKVFEISMYCRYGQDIEPYLAYMDRVHRYAREKCVIFGMDANATLPLWFSKGRYRSRENEMRGRSLEEWIVLNGMIVLNEPMMIVLNERLLFLGDERAE